MVLLVLVFLVEVLTPNVVVGTLALVPLLAGMWLLSNQPAAFVGSMAALLFSTGFVAEPGNRWTIILAGIAMLTVALLARIHATGLASVMSSGGHISGLTKRELEVARLAGQAYTAAEIGVRLHIGERTVETHLANTYTKLRISSRRELIRIAWRLEPVNDHAPPSARLRP